MSDDRRRKGEGRSALRRWRPLLLASIAGLYVLSVPWYREPGATPAIWLGLPDWVAVSVLCYVAVAVLNALAWLGTDVVDDRAAGEACDGQASGSTPPRETAS